MSSTNGHAEEHDHYHGVDQAEKHPSLREALRKFLQTIEPVGTEIITYSESLGRFLAEDIHSKLNVPLTARSTRDGYALKIKGDTAQISSTFCVVGNVNIGATPKLFLKEGQAAKVATGSSIPRGGNAVVMKEYVKEATHSIVINRSTKLGDDILREGEDIARGALITRKHTMIRPQHFALLSETGVRRFRVFQRPKIAFFSTGDELAEAGKLEVGRKIYDMNRPFLQAAITELGAQPEDLGIVRDDFSLIRKKIVQGLKSDALILSAGSSVGERDYASKAVNSISGVRSLVHGVAMRPSSPTGLATFKGKPLVMLPGFPTSAIVSFFVFARPAILKLLGSDALWFPTVKARLIEGYEGKQGVSHLVRVHVKRDGRDYLAAINKPTEAYYSSWLGGANGIAIIADQLPVKAGAEVDVFLIGDVGQDQS